MGWRGFPMFSLMSSNFGMWWNTIRICNLYDLTRFVSGVFGSFAHGFPSFSMWHLWVLLPLLKETTCDSRHRFADGHERLQDASDLRCRAVSGKLGRWIQFYPNSAPFYPTICQQIHPYCPDILESISGPGSISACWGGGSCRLFVLSQIW